MMPPKMFTRIAFTLSSEVRILNASTTWIENLSRHAVLKIDAAKQTTMQKKHHVLRWISMSSQSLSGDNIAFQSTDNKKEGSNITWYPFIPDPLRHFHQHQGNWQVYHHAT
jgi:hypothetical protein